MDREKLRTILERVAGLKRDADTFRCPEGNELPTVYLGELGRAMVVSHVQSIALLDTHIEVEAKDRGTLYAPLDAVHAVQSALADKKGQKRGGVGFSD